MNKAISVPVGSVLSARGDKIVGGETYHAYKLFLSGFRDSARAALEQLHFQTYYGPQRNLTTDAIVKEIYQEKGVQKPSNYMNSSAEIVLQAVKKRVDDYLIQLENFKEKGYIETTIVKMSPRGNDFIMRSCGENKVAALAALGHKEIPKVVIL